MLTYAGSLSKAEAGERIFKFIEEIFTDKTDIIMTYGEQLELKGRQEEKLGIARNMLHNLHLGTEIVQQATGLSKQELASL